MDERYEVIESYLQECVNEDIYTEDKANMILELAYDKYIIEKSESNNSSDLKERIKKNKKKIIALIAICTASIIFIHKIMKDKKVIESQKKSLKSMEKLFVEESKKCKDLKSQVEKLEADLKDNDNFYKRLANERWKEIKNLEKQNKDLEDLKLDNEVSGSLEKRRRQTLSQIQDKLRDNNRDRITLAYLKDQHAKNQELGFKDKNKMQSIIKIEKDLKQRETEIDKLQKSLRPHMDNQAIIDSYHKKLEKENKMVQGLKVDKVKLD